MNVYVGWVFQPTNKNNILKGGLENPPCGV